MKIKKRLTYFIRPNWLFCALGSVHHSERWSRRLTLNMRFQKCSFWRLRTISNSSFTFSSNRLNLLSTKSFQFHIYRQTPIRKFIRIIEVQLFNIKSHLKDKESSDEKHKRNSTYVIQWFDFIFSVLKNMAIRTKNNSLCFSKTKKRERKESTSFLATILLCTFDPLPEAIPRNRLYFLYDNSAKKWRRNQKTKEEFQWITLPCFCKSSQIACGSLSMKMINRGIFKL